MSDSEKLRERIQVQLDIQRDAVLKIEEIIKPFVEECTWVYAVPNAWDCKNSPFDTCAYNKFEDKAWDSCIFCGDPYERK